MPWTWRTDDSEEAGVGRQGWVGEAGVECGSRGGVWRQGWGGVVGRRWRGRGGGGGRDEVGL
jgi:hypothetical protein